MRVEVLYVSRGGTTKRIAEEIAKEVKAEAKNLKDNPKIANFDMAFVGSGNYGVEPDSDIVEMTEKVTVKNKKIAIFGTSGGQFNAITEMVEIFRKAGAKVVGKWGCKGKFLFFSKIDPSEKDLKEARKFARNMLKHMNKS